MTPIDMELALLDSAEYLYLPERSEPRDNSLQLVVQETVVNRSGLFGGHHPERPQLAKILNDASPIESTDARQIFELTWKHHVAYLVSEECVGSCGHSDDEIFSGKLFPSGICH
jgi:hypothetical protein